MITHANLNALCLSRISALSCRRADVVSVAIPLFHSGGIGSAVSRLFFGGSTVKLGSVGVATSAVEVRVAPGPPQLLAWRTAVLATQAVDDHRLELPHDLIDALTAAGPVPLRDRIHHSQ